MRLNLENESVVVIPSVTLDRLGERQREHDTGLRGAVPLPPAAAARAAPAHGVRHVDADRPDHHRVLPGPAPWRDPQPCPARLSLVSVGDGTPRPLSEKLLERPRLLRRIAALIPDPALCHLVPYNTTALERDIAVALGIPMYGADPRLVHLGTKTGCRRLFAEEGVRHPSGVRTCTRSMTSRDAVISMRAQRTDRRR